MRDLDAEEINCERWDDARGGIVDDSGSVLDSVQCDVAEVGAGSVAQAAAPASGGTDTVESAGVQTGKSKSKSWGVWPFKW